ncbi:MAG: stalk domain-containing protein, partial [bacterium]|nr:stalk domain-containing protein [bacterium]
REQTGSLSVDCNIPNAEVYLDDEYLGTVTNGGAALFDRISAGRYRLVVRTDGYEDHGRTIEIKTGERLQLEVKLERSSRTGSLEILSDPSGASVMIDGQSMGVAPRSISDIAEGEHDVLLLAAGYMEWRAVVRVESGKTASVHAVLVRETPTAVEPPASALPPVSPISVPPVTPQDQSTDVVIVTGSSPSVYVNGRQVETDIAPAITAGRVMVPLRGVFQAFGVTVIWNPDTRTVICTTGERTVTLRPGSREASINGKAHRIDAPPVLKNGRVLVPLRFISEALAADVRWDGNLKRVYIEPMRP